MYGILSLLKSLKGKDAMRRVLQVTQKHPDFRPVRTGIAKTDSATSL